MSYYSMSGFGAFGAVVVFNAQEMWDDQVAGSPEEFGGAGDNFRGKRWAQKMQGALNDVQNAGLTIDGQWGPKSKAAWKEFASSHGLTVADQPTSVGDLVVLQRALDPSSVTGGGSGGAKLVSVSTVGGAIAPSGEKKEGGGGEGGPVKSGLSTGAMVGIAAAVVGVVGLLAVAAKKKPGTGPYGRPAPTMVANRHRHH